MKLGVSQDSIQLNASGFRKLSLILAGTWSGNVAVYGSNDNKTWTLISGAGANGTYTLDVKAYFFVKIQKEKWVSGDVDITPSLFQDADTSAKARAILTFTGQPSDADTVTIDTVAYTFKTTLTGAFASGTITSDNTNPSNDDTITINDQTYRFEGTLAQANDVKIGADANTTLANLKAAINQSGVAGTNYFAGTVAPTDVSAGTLDTTAHTLIVTAKTIGTGPNAYVFTKSSTHLTVSGSGTLAGGVATVVREVLIGDTVSGTIQNLIDAIMALGSAGVDYGAGTTAHSTVTADQPSASQMRAIAKTAGTAGNAKAVSKSCANASWDHATLTGGAA